LQIDASSIDPGTHPAVGPAVHTNVIVTSFRKIDFRGGTNWRQRV
jgi:hypothetical protein